MSAWSIVCAIELGLLQKSSLKDVTIASYLDLDFLRGTEKDAQGFSDFGADNREDIVSDRTPASIYDGSWPFIDPARITRITLRKSVRKQSKKRRWTMKRPMKPNADNARWDIDDTTTNLSIKRAASSLGDIQHENLGVSKGGPTGLSGNKFSLTQLHARWSDRDGDKNCESLSESYGSADEDEGVCRATSETSSSEIVQIDYSGAGYSRFYTPNCQKKDSQNRTELSEYPDYFSNVLHIDDNDTENDSNTTVTDNYNTRSRKFEKFREHVPRKINTRTSVKNGNTLGNIRRRSLRKKSRHHLRSRKNHLKESLKERSNKLVRRKKKSGNSVTNNDYNLRISRDLEENSSECKSDARGGFAVDKRDTVKIVRRRCDCNFTNTACTCKRNLKSIATAIMRDIQAHIRSAEIDVENISDFTIFADSPDEKPDDKDLNRDISMEYDWIGLEDNGNLNNGEISPHKSKQSSDLTKVNPTESFIDISMKRRHKRRLNRYTIDCKFVDRTETAYRSVFHECVDSPIATSSLKINMDESWRSEDDNGVEMIHSSWRRSVSFTEDCDNEFDSALLLARKIVSDDLTKDEKYYNDEHETLENTCYKYHETEDCAISRDISLHDSRSDEKDAKFANQHAKTKNIITYKKKDRNIWRLSSMDRNFVKNEIDKVNDI